MKGGAQFSSDRVYRYALWRSWDDAGKRAMFVGLNPSTADESADDPTIRRCIGFAKRLGCSSIQMLNLFALRSTDPRGLLDVADPVGPDNDAGLATYSELADIVIACWGAWPAATERARTVAAMIDSPLYCLGLTKSGAPRHPLYLRADAPLLDYKGAR